jgi:uncharacterized RDD family membrane protein YckC
MSIITITTPFNIDLEFSIAPFHKRLLAWAIDMVAIVAYVYLAIRFLAPMVGMNKYEYGEALYLVLLLPAYSYHLIFELVMNGQTPGKKAMRLKVVDKTGKAATTSQYFIRWLLRLVDMGVTMGAGAVLSIALSRFNQRIGDFAAGTVIIDASAKTGLGQTIYRDVEGGDADIMFPEVMRLTDRDINGIRNLLDEKQGNRDNEAYKEKVTERIKQVLSIESDLEPDEFLHRLLRDYNVITRR